MECKKLYLENLDCLESTAVVLACESRKDGLFDLITDRTPLFPEGGGQRSDRGTVNGAAIVHCREEKDTVIHTAAAPFAVGETVEITVDAALRRLHTQQHTGEHMLSYAYQHLFGATNIGFHMSEDVVTIDLDRMLTAEEIEAGETYANEMVEADLPVTISIVDGETAADLPLRKRNDKLTEGIRIVTIGDGEMCTCCGTHFTHTAPVGMIKVLEYGKYKQGCRVTFVCGALARKWFRMENSELRRTAARLSVKPEGVYDALLRKEEHITELHLQLRRKNAQMAELYAAKLEQTARVRDGCRIVAGLVAVGVDAAKQIAERLCADRTTVTVLFCEDGPRMRYFCLAGEACPVSCRDIAMQINKALNAKGGGSPKTAQGSFEKTDEAQLQAFADTL